VQEFAITVIGHDRPGIIAGAAEALANLGLNLTDSTMTRLRGHFAMTLICVGPTTLDEIEAALRPLTETGLVVTVREVGAEPEPAPSGGSYLLTVHGADRLGIVAAVTRVIAGVEGNVTDLSTRLSGDLYVLVAEVDLPSTVDIPSLEARLAEVAAELGVGVRLRPAEVDVL